MTNRRVLAVSDNSTANKQVKRGATSAVWSAKQAVDGDGGSAGTYVSSATLNGHGPPARGRVKQVVPADR